MVGVLEYLQKKVNSYQVELINDNLSKHLREVFQFQKVDMARDKFSEIDKTKKSAKGTVYWSCKVHDHYHHLNESKQLAKEEYETSKVKQVTKNLRLPFVATSPTLNLPGSLLSKVKDERQFQENLLYSDAYLDVTFLTYLLKLSTCMCLWKILILGSMYFEILPFLTYFNFSWLTLLVPWILAFLMLRLIKILNGWMYHHAVNFPRFENKRIQLRQLEIDGNKLCKSIENKKNKLSSQVEMTEKLNFEIDEEETQLKKLRVEVEELSKSIEGKKFKNRKPIGFYQVIKKFKEGFGLVSLTLETMSRVGMGNSSVQEYLIEEINEAYKTINEESNVHHPLVERDNRLRTWITNQIELRLNNLISSNLSFDFDYERDSVTYNTNFYPIGEGVQYTNIDDNPNLARANLGILSRNRDPILSPTLPNFESKEGEYNHHGSTNEGTMRQAILKGVDWREPLVIFHLLNAFGMENSMRVLEFLARTRVVEGSWESEWLRLPFEEFKDRLELELDNPSNSSSYPKDNKRMFRLMNFRTSWCMTIPHDRMLKDVCSVTQEVLANEDLSTLHPNFRAMKDLMQFLEVPEDESRSRNRLMLIDGIPTRLVESSEIPEILRIKESNFWDDMSKMVPKLRISVGQEATSQPDLTEGNLFEVLKVLKVREESYYPYFPVEFNPKHVIAEFSVITSLVASRDVRRHRTGLGWDHKVLINELNGRRSLIIHPLYNQPEVSELMNGFPTNLIERDTISLASLSQFPSSALMKLSNHMPFDMVVFLLKTRIQSNLEYGLLFATFYLKLLNTINELELGENCKSYLRATLTWNVKKEEVTKRLKEIGLNDGVIDQWLKRYEGLLELDDNLKKFNSLSNEG